MAPLADLKSSHESSFGNCEVELVSCSSTHWTGDNDDDDDLDICTYLSLIHVSHLHVDANPTGGSVIVGQTCVTCLACAQLAYTRCHAC